VTGRKRVGLLVPSSNTVMEPDLQVSLGRVATVHTARMLLAEPVTWDAEAALLDRHAPEAARGIATLEPDVVVFGCASAGTIRGPAADKRLRLDLSEIAGAPVIGVFDVLAAALRKRGAGRIALLTPYPEDVTAGVVAGLREEGFDVAGDRSLGVVSNLAVGRIEPHAIASEALELLDATGPMDALVITCTNLRALEARAEIAAASGVEVVTANSAAVERTLAALGSTNGGEQH
jgi:maleate isomerase